MGTTRTPINRNKIGRITTLALDTYRRARDLHDNRNVEKWEGQGGRRREYLDACGALDVMLGRKPWQTSIMDCVGEDTSPDYVRDEDDWYSARALLTALEQAAAGR